MHRRADIDPILSILPMPSIQPAKQKIGAITDIMDTRQFKAGDIVFWGPTTNPSLFNQGTIALGEFKKGKYGQSSSTHVSIIIGRKEGDVIHTGIMSSSDPGGTRAEIIIGNLTEEEKKQADGPFMAHFAEIGEKEKDKVKSPGNARKYYRDSVKGYGEERSFQIARLTQENEVQQSLITQLTLDAANQVKWTSAKQYWSAGVAAKAIFNPHRKRKSKDTLPAERRAYICSGWVAERLDVTAIKYKASLIDEQLNSQREHKQAEELASNIQTEYKNAELLASKLVHFSQFAIESKKKADALKAEADELKLAVERFKIRTDKAQEKLNMLEECSFQVGLKAFCMPATLEDKLYINSHIKFFSYPGCESPTTSAIDQYQYIRQAIYKIVIRLILNAHQENAKEKSKIQSKYKRVLNAFKQAQLQIDAWNKKSASAPLNSLEMAQILFALMKDTLNFNTRTLNGTSRPTTSYELLLKAGEKIGLFQRDLEAIQPLVNAIKTIPIILDAHHLIEAPFYELIKTLVQTELFRLKKMSDDNSIANKKYSIAQSDSNRLDKYIREESKLDLNDTEQNRQAARIYLSATLKDLEVSRGWGLFKTTSAEDILRGAAELGILRIDSSKADALSSQLFSTRQTHSLPTSRGLSAGSKHL